MSWLLSRHVGLRGAQEFFLTNHKVSADEAATIGMVTRTVSEDQFAQEVAKTALVLADAPTGAIADTRGLLLESSHSLLEGQFERETRSIATAGGSAACGEGVAAFTARCKPGFSGDV